MRDETPVQTILYGAANAYATLMAGFTTVQSLGSFADRDLRDAIARGVLPGPRVLTSLRAVNAGTGSPDDIRAYVRRLAEDGADVVKVFASASIREGGGLVMSTGQLEAVCTEAQAVGLRTVGPRLRHRRVDGDDRGRAAAASSTATGTTTPSST